jgi:predicted amidophosphoribosyltransferase
MLSNRLCRNCLRRIGNSILPRSVRFNLAGNLKVASMTNYTESMKEFIYLCKSAPFNGFMPPHKTLLKELCAHWSTEFSDAKIDAVVPIPGHPFRTIIESDLTWHIARFICKGLGKAEPMSLLKRKYFINGKVYKSQKDLDKWDRAQMIKEQYYLPANGPENMRLLLVDDVCTTGSTLRHCKELLESKGHKIVSSIVLSKVSQH